MGHILGHSSNAATQIEMGAGDENDTDDRPLAEHGQS